MAKRSLELRILMYVERRGESDRPIPVHPSEYEAAVKAFPKLEFVKLTEKIEHKVEL